MKLSKGKLYILSIASGLLFALAWPPLPVVFSIFIAFVPLLFVEDYISKNNFKKPGWTLFLHSMIAFIIFNLLTTWWVKNSTVGGAAMMTVLNSVFMCIPVLLYRSVKKKTRANYAFISLIAFWIAFEFCHMQWELSWSWLNLGNVFANSLYLIQWYDVTGALGGTLWVLLVNIFVFKLLENFKTKGKLKPAIQIGLLLIVPVVISLVKKSNFKPEGNKITVVAVQPNIDPYSKFSSSPDEQLDKLIDLSKSKADANTDYIVWPETAIPSRLNIDYVTRKKQIDKPLELIAQFPTTALVTGLEGIGMYEREEEAAKNGDSPKQRFLNNGDTMWTISVNSSIQLVHNDDDVPLYLKSKLVPAVERLPFKKVLGPLANIFSQFGGTTGGYSAQPNREVFEHNGVEIGTAICYESIYGEFVGRFVKEGAQAIFIITNDAWWGNTAGHKQHMQYASLRAIETRRSFVRSANTGISCFINPLGEIRQKTTFWTPDAIKGEMQLNNKLTFYVNYGDYIGRIATFIAVVILLYVFVRKRFMKK